MVTKKDPGLNRYLVVVSFDNHLAGATFLTSGPWADALVAAGYLVVLEEGVTDGAGNGGTSRAV